MKYKATIYDTEKAANETKQFFKKYKRNRFISLCAGLFLVCEVYATAILARSGYDLPWLHDWTGIFGAFFITTVAIAIAVTYHFEAEESTPCDECCLATQKPKS